MTWPIRGHDRRIYNGCSSRFLQFPLNSRNLQLPLLVLSLRSTNDCACHTDGLNCAVHLTSRGKIRRRRGGAKAWPWLGVMLWVWGALAVPGADLKEAQELYLSGDYPACVDMTEQMVRRRPASEEWQLLLSQALLASGKYPQAYQAITNALEENNWSVRLKWQAREVFLCNGLTEAAAEIPDRIIERVNGQPPAYRDAESLVVYGRAALLKNADPKQVLDTLFDSARRADPTSREPYLASGQLALDKHDFALAAKRFEEGLKQLPEDPDLLCGLAEAYAPSDGSLMADALEKALTRNSNHVGSLLLLADRSIDAEDYAEAERLLDRIQSINPWSPEAWSYAGCGLALKHSARPRRFRPSKRIKILDKQSSALIISLGKIVTKLSLHRRRGASTAGVEIRSGLPAGQSPLAQDLFEIGRGVRGLGTGAGGAESRRL